MTLPSVLLAFLLGTTLGPANAQDVDYAKERALGFRSESSAHPGQLMVASLFVMLLAIAGIGAVWVRRRGWGGKLLPGAAREFAIELIAVKRITPRMTIFALKIDGGEVVVFADNGHGLLQLARYPSNPSASP